MERGFRMVYLDYAATAPMSDEAIRMYGEVATTYYGNASSLHEAGWYAAQILQLTREQIASILSVSSDGIYFTGSGTEGNLIAILSIVLGQKKANYYDDGRTHFCSCGDEYIDKMGL